MGKQSRRHRNRRPEPTAPNYLAPVMAAAKLHAVPGRFLHLVTLHDHDCPFPSGLGPCRCTPEVMPMSEHLRNEAGKN